MNNYFQIFIKRLFVISIILSSQIYFNACVDLSSGPEDELSNGTKKISIYSPTNNTEIGEGINEVVYSIKPPYSLRFVELYINGQFKRNFPPNQDGTAPQIKYIFDSTYLYKTINLYLIYYDNNGTSEKSNLVENIFVTIDNRLPFQPYSLSLIKFNDGSVNISWRDSSRYVERYEIWKKSGVLNDYALLQEVTGNSNNINDYNLDPNQIYFYKVRGIKKSGSSPFSVEINTAGIYTSGNLIPPTNLIALVVAPGTVQLNWNDKSENENYFAVERSTDKIQFIRLAALPRNTTTYKDSASGLLTNAIYYYRVKAFSNSDSAYSNTIEIKITSGTLNAPANLSGIYNSTVGVIELRWSKTDNNTVYFDIERKTDSGNYQLLRRVDAANTIYLDFSIEKNRTYSYRIRGYDLNIFSAYSNEIIIETN